MDIVWRVFESFQADRVMLVAAGVTFYGLLALFPATAAVVSLYGLFTDATTITNHLGLLSGFLPDGALEVIGDQVKRLTPRPRHFGVRPCRHLGALFVGRQRRDQGNLRRPERHLQGTREAQLHPADPPLVGLYSRRHGAGAARFRAVVAVPVAFKVIGVPDGSTASLLT